MTPFSNGIPSFRTEPLQKEKTPGSGQTQGRNGNMQARSRGQVDRLSLHDPVAHEGTRRLMVNR